MIFPVKLQFYGDPKVASLSMKMTSIFIGLAPSSARAEFVHKCPNLRRRKVSFPRHMSLEMMKLKSLRSRPKTIFSVGLGVRTFAPSLCVALAPCPNLRNSKVYFPRNGVPAKMYFCGVNHLSLENIKLFKIQLINGNFL